MEDHERRKETITKKDTKKHIKKEENLEPIIKEEIVPTIIKPVDTSIIENVEQPIIQSAKPEVIMPENIISQDINYDFNFPVENNNTTPVQDKPEELKFVNNQVPTNADDYTSVFDINNIEIKFKSM